jgi:hypothetical protein
MRIAGDSMLPIQRTPFYFLAIGLLSFILFSPAWANFAPRFWGDIASEPAGFKEVTINQEQLVIDLRPLVRAEPARVEATYNLLNCGASKHLDLLFISGEVGVADFEARLDGKLLLTRLLPAAEAARLWKSAPESWRPPRESPGLAENETFYVLRDYGRPWDMVGLSLELPPGPSTLRVKYSTHACGTAERPTVTWQLPYVLAPAREWGGFGQLDVLVYLPNGWEARSTPALDRHGDTLRGNFEGIPADALMIATGAPVPPEYHWAVWLSNALWVVVLVGGPVMCWWVGRRLGSSRAGIKLAGTEPRLTTRLRGLLVQILPGPLWGAIIYMSVPVSIGTLRASLHGQENPSLAGEPGFVGPCLNFVIIPFAVLLGIGITAWSASRSFRRTESG